MSVRTRFAPSPTGFLHIGGVRTALYAWLYAKHHQGEFILRVEDTDRQRSTEASVNAILEGMDWCGLAHDEGPFYQTQRFDRYHNVIEQLLASGKAYHCRCSVERLTALRESQIANKQKPRYDGRCRDAGIVPREGEATVVRFRNPESGQVAFHDQVYGDISVENSELDDLIIARSDGTPTYNLTVVVDDWDMNITHVIRGDDHINNTPRQINILKALGADIPLYAHLPMILGDDGKRLSKRHGAVSVLEYKAQGFLREAVLNYLVRLGWSHGDQEVFSLDEMIQLFDFDHIGRSPSTFNTEKLIWLNQHYLKTLPPEQVAEQLQWHFDALNINTQQGPSLPQVVTAQCERAKTLNELAEKSRYFYQDIDSYDEKAARKHLVATLLAPLGAFAEKCKALDVWEKEAIHALVVETAQAFELKMGKLAQPIRVAVTGGTVSPSIDITLELIGQARVCERLENALTFIQQA